MTLEIILKITKVLEDQAEALEKQDKQITFLYRLVGFFVGYHIIEILIKFL